MSEDASMHSDSDSLAATGQAEQYRFTIFTPTYNRAHTLNRVVESLAAQTYRDFEWLIVDDGSMDGTGELVKSWQSTCNFPIRYVWQENQGAHAAFNRAVTEARGEFFLFAGSDDSFPPDALDILNRNWEAIPDVDKPGFVGVTGLCVDQNGKLVGDRFPKDVFDSDNIEKRYVHKIKGEKWGFSRTEILRQFPFPTVPGARYVPEIVVWSPIGRRFKTRYVNEVVRNYYVNDGTTDHLSDFKDYSAMAFGARMMNSVILNNELPWFKYEPMGFFKAAANYARFSLHNGTGLGRQFADLKGSCAKLLWLAALPVGIAAYAKDRRKMRRTTSGALQ